MMNIKEDITINKASWVANQYKTFKKEKSDRSDKEIYKMIIKAHFSDKQNPIAEAEMINKYADGLKGLSAVTFLLLDEEEEIMRESDEQQKKYLEVINKELKSQGLSSNEISVD